MSERITELLERASAGLQLLRAARGGENGRGISGESAVRASVFDGQSRIHEGVQRTTGMARFAPSRTHKASSAEAILSHVLRQRGWTKRWREGRLTDRQHLQLLEDIRQYGRQWMRHEAEAFFGRYGADGSRSLVPHSLSVENGALASPDGVDTQGQGMGESPARGSDDIGGSGWATRSLSGRILSPFKRWFDRSRQFIRELIFGGAIALKGSELTAQEAEQADQLAAIQARYLDNFEREIVANPPVEISSTDLATQVLLIQPPRSIGQRVAQAEMYANSAWQAAQKVQRSSKARAGATRWERLVLGKPKTEHCHECPPDAALGWVPFGTLRPIGDRECENLCLCHFEYSDSVEMPTGKGSTKPEKPKTIPVTEEEHIKQVAQELYDKLKQGLKLKVVIGVGRPNG